MATDCPACLAVSRGGRIRLNEETAELFLDLLRDKRNEQLQFRRLALNVEGDPTVYNERISTVDVAIAELQRTRTEMGWGHGQPQRQDT